MGMHIRWRFQDGQGKTENGEWVVQSMVLRKSFVKYFVSFRRYLNANWQEKTENGKMKIQVTEGVIHGVKSGDTVTKEDILPWLNRSEF
jgi:hypothetical protein